jgi:hypothetical protein
MGEVPFGRYRLISAMGQGANPHNMSIEEFGQRRRAATSRPRAAAVST